MSLRQPRDLRRTQATLLAPYAADGPYFRLLGCGVDYGVGPWPAMSFFEDASGVYGGWIYVISGSVRYELDGRQHRVTPGQALINRRPEPGRLLRPLTAEPLHALWINVGGEPAMTIFEHLRTRYGQIQRLPPQCEAIRRAKELIRLARANADRDPHFWSGKTYAWLDAWWRCADEQRRPVDTQALLARPSRVLSVPKSVKEFAAQLGYSRAYLTRKLSKRWDDTPARVLRRLRLEEAERKLRNTALSLNEIAEQCGYTSSIAFSRAFKRKYGQAPGTFRHTHR